MTEKLPDNLEEALEFIQKLQAENTKLKSTVDKQNIMLSNLNEMLVKGRKAMFGSIRQLIPRLYKYPEKCYNNHKVQRSPRKSRDSVEQDGS